MDSDHRDYDKVVVNESDIHKIVQSYLMYNCFVDTLESFVACIGANNSVENMEDMAKRKEILSFVMEGNASKAIELTDEYVPGLLEGNKDLHFDILSLQFIELVRSKKINEALGFAQSKFFPFGKEEKYVKKLEDLMALLAYEEPEKSPIFHLLSPELREEVAKNLNRAILEHNKHPCYSAMEQLIRQTTVASQELCKDGHQPFSLNDFMKV